MLEKVLIHAAFFHEAKPVIEHYRLKCVQKKPYRIYENDEIVLCILGMGAENTLALDDLFKQYNVKKAINLGIAGCRDISIEIGSLFCTSHDLGFIKRESLSCVDKPLDNETSLETTLVDMESAQFMKISQRYLKKEHIYILKIVSDHLETKIPKKEFVWKIIEKNLKEISRVVTLQD